MFQLSLSSLEQKWSLVFDYDLYSSATLFLIIVFSTYMCIFCYEPLFLYCSQGETLICTSGNLFSPYFWWEQSAAEEEDDEGVTLMRISGAPLLVFWWPCCSSRLWVSDNTVGGNEHQGQKSAEIMCDLFKIFSIFSFKSLCYVTGTKTSPFMFCLSL